MRRKLVTKQKTNYTLVHSTSRINLDNFMGVQNKPQKKELANRTFGLIFAVIFLLIALFPLLGDNGVRNWAFIVSTLFAAASIFMPSLLTPLNKLFVKFGELMHKITNPLLMGLVFFIAVVPTAIFARIFGKDPMRRKIDASANSYWIEREQHKITPESFDQQF
jgi:hypothetical protein